MAMLDGEKLKGRSITILGAGVSGIAIASLARGLGADVFVSDAAEIDGAAAASLASRGISFEQGGHTDRVLLADVVVVGSGFPPSAPILEKLASRGKKPVGELDFVMPHMRGTAIGVTGSNGKTTTTSLIGSLINAVGAKCAVAGNIGSPIADFAGEDYEYAAIELSSFQLHWASSARLGGAVVTNLAPDHIDWHGSYENYTAAKARILTLAAPDGFGVAQSRDAATLGAGGPRFHRLSWSDGPAVAGISLSARDGAARMDGEELFRFSETKLIGSHNMENVAMAMAVVKLLGLDVARARSALASYKAPPHRCALVGEIGGVRYIDDSKGTNIAASTAAMSSIDGPHIVILGGRGKGEDYANLIEPLRKFAKRAILIGEVAAEIARALTKGGCHDFIMAGDLESAVMAAAGMAKPGDSVLLSPACTSWDVYKNYGERGDHFAAVVAKLSGGAG
jgi:UDP-N-acetylmuramoylalanine--D-glutamate ligase